MMQEVKDRLKNNNLTLDDLIRLEQDSDRKVQYAIDRMPRELAIDPHYEELRRDLKVQIERQTYNL